MVLACGRSPSQGSGSPASVLPTTAPPARSAMPTHRTLPIALTVYSVALATMITIFPCCSGFSRLAAPPGMCSANGCPASADAQNLETETREELNYAKERLLANGDRPQCERQG
jgi:hypothetical protein